MNEYGGLVVLPCERGDDGYVAIRHGSINCADFIGA